jgi:hypothetical protein
VLVRCLFGTAQALGQGNQIPAGCRAVKVFTDHAQLGTFLACLLVVPGVKLKSSFDENRAAFLEVLLGYFRQTCPKVTSSRFCGAAPSLSVQTSFIARPSSAIAVPFGVWRMSGSRVRFPIR